MTRKELWDQYCKKNPQFNDPKAIIKMKGSGLRKFFDTTFDKAHELGFRNGQAAKKDKKSDYKKMADDICGKDSELGKMFGI